MTLRTPLVPVQGQLLFPVAVPEKVAGPGLPDQPHPHCPCVKTTRLFLPSSAEEAGIELSLAVRLEPPESAWDWLGWCCLRAPSPTSCSSTRSHCHSGQLLPLDFTAGSGKLAVLGWSMASPPPPAPAGILGRCWLEPPQPCSSSLGMPCTSIQ